MENKNELLDETLLNLINWRDELEIMMIYISDEDTFRDILKLRDTMQLYLLKVSKTYRADDEEILDRI